MSGLAADVPQTDRELLLQIHTKIVGRGGLCEVQENHGTRLTNVEHRQWIACGAVSLALVLLGWWWWYV